MQVIYYDENALAPTDTEIQADRKTSSGVPTCAFVPATKEIPSNFVT